MKRIVNDIARMIHEVDTNHPTGTKLAGINKRGLDYIKALYQDIDILSINTYGGIASLLMPGSNCWLGRPLYGHRMGTDGSLGRFADWIEATYRRNH